MKIIKTTIIVEKYTDNKYMGYIDNDDYMGCVVQGDSLSRVLKELSISVKIYEKYINKQNEK